jgi:hypothetical protein
MMMQAKLPVIEGNRSIQDGSLATIVDQVVEKMKPECVYFTSLGGCRAVIAVFDLKSPSDIPSIAEPLFMGLNASVDFLPCMNPEDLKIGLAKLK